MMSYRFDLHAYEHMMDYGLQGWMTTEYFMNMLNFFPIGISSAAR